MSGQLVRRRIAIGLSLVVLVATGLGLPSAQPASAASVSCSGAIIAFGRQRWCGYFKNGGYDTGVAVRLAGLPASVDTTGEFITFIQTELDLPNTTAANRQRITAAKFIIQTMRQRGPGSPQSVSAAERADWISRVSAFGNISQNGTTSVGENGSIQWHVLEHMACGSVNTFYQQTLDDVAPYLNSAGNSECEVASSRDEMVIFRDNSNSVVYRIRRACMNPLGNLPALPPAPADQYSLLPAVAATVGGNPIVGGVEVGQTIRFSYSVTNSGPDPSGSTNCSIYTNVHAGYFAEPGTPTGSGGAGPATGCPRTFATGPPVVLTQEDVLVAAGNQTICRSLFVTPSTQALPAVARGDEECVPVINKPYLKVFGGDISAGNGQSTMPGTCVSNPTAAVIGWSKGTTDYAGAGVQYAIIALHQIYETATGGLTAGPMPSVTAFANTAPNGSIYGGSFGSVPCIPDYYAQMPATTLAFTSLPAATVSGAYMPSGAGPFSISGAVASGARVTLYAPGDVFITGDITYPATWSSGTAPLFRLVARGNIYIRNTVSRIDGVLIAQQSGASGGTIYTCATAAAPLTAGTGLHAACSNRLTVNGAFVAKSVQFLRTAGTRQQAPANEASGSSNIAETFNFSPGLWMAQPPISGSPAQYDSITSLPPIL